MEDLGDLDLCGVKVSDADNLYFEDLDNDIDNLAKMSRPSSTASLASWTFSPIQDDDNSEILDAHQPKKSDQESTNQQFYIVSNQPISSQESAQPTVNYNQQQLHQTHNSASEYHFPNTITYHHSVNIHNYVGSYCAPQPTWRDACMWEGMGQHALPSMSEPYPDRQPTSVLKAENQPDPVAALTMPGMEFTRCSTPEYLMALNSLHQLDSPPKPNHSAAAMDFSSSFEDCASHSSSVKQQDSGYNSDLSVSPVIQYQNNQARIANKPVIKRQTSTPNSYQQYLAIAPILHKEGMAHGPQHHALPHRLAMTMPSLRPKYVCANKPAGVVPQPVYPAGFNVIPQMAHSIPSQKTEEFIGLNKTPALKPISISDYDLMKKKDTQSKPKPKSDIKPQVKPKISSSGININSSRRRHNEPLNNDALDVMNDWYQAHKDNPYPTKAEKEQLAKAGGISLSQVKSWFANKRNRNNNTRPKKQKQVMEEQLMDLCHQLARDARRPTKDNAYYIQQLSCIIDKTKMH